jgi:hypothetical protein
MELYHKQLNSVAELKLERERIKKASKKKAKKAKKLAAADATDDSPMASLATIAQKLMSSKGDLSDLAMPIFRLALKQTQKNGFLKKVAVEVLGGYVKWKAIDMGITLAMRFIRRQKHKANKEHKDY